MTAERRRHIRVPGPFRGWQQVGTADTPIQIEDLSEGGCFIHSLQNAPTIGQRLVLRIDLPGESMLTLEGETVYARPGAGYGVLFTGLTDAAYSRLERAVEKLRRRAPARA